MGGPVIQTNLVYHKSAKGAEAIATRQHGLSPKQRSMLIMVDGKHSVEELVPLAQMLGNTEELLGQLLDQGFIEPGGSVSSAPAPLASAPAALSPAAAPTHGPGLTLVEAQRFVSRRLTDLLGPNAEELCLRIEGTKNVHDFQVAVARAEGMLRQFRSAHVAEEFAAEVRSHLPAG
jgi:hypothetical protein